ncbi:MAG: 1-deoxy-D-xylulose-5-phosphate reductoisomerase, partial [Bacteroidetes bacterium]|nr:1-deoxy-D-xylulose-5-phosphate reductoisomerase [Bacteroidota bacterium]
VETNQIEVVIHPQSIIHSIVEFEDGSMKAQMGLPDMRIPIQYALSFPYRLKSDFPSFSFTDYPNLTFEKPDLDTFKNLDLAYFALNKGGNTACILNAANEIAVSAFLKEKLNFLEISEIIESCMDKVPYIASPSLEDYVETDSETRIKASELVNL